MKGYCTAADVRNALAPLDQQDDLATAARLTDTQINDAIDEAEGIVDTYITMRYSIVPITVPIVPDPDFPNNTVPVLVAPSPLRGATRDVAAFLAALTANKGKNMTEEDPIRLRFGVAMSLLTSIRDGKANLDPELFPPVDQSNDIVVVNQYEPAMFHASDVGLYPAGYNAQVIIPASRW